ncbi:MAG: response regulator [Verrucomicrobiota bacterium]
MSSNYLFELSETLKQTTILIVDDLEDNRDLLEQMLLEQGFESTLKAASGTEALALLENNTGIGLILLDLMMPVMDGYETARRISSNAKTGHIPIIIVTGGALRRDDALMKSFQCGAMDFIPKPVGEVELYARAKSALVMFHDRVGIRDANLALRESKQRYDLAVNGVSEGIFDINFQTGEVFYSTNWKKILGYADDEVPNRFGIWENLVHPDDHERVLNIIHEHWEKHTPYYSSEHRLRAKNGEYKWVYSRGCAVWDERGKVVRMAGSTTDITQRRALEVQLRQAQQMESIGRLAAGVAHDFNNLLTTIVGQANLARMHLPADSPVRDNCEKIERTAMQAADFCKKMLAYAGQGCYAAEHADLSILTAQIAEIVQHSISKKINIRYDLATQPLVVEADTAQLRHVIMNLLINASEAIGDTLGAIAIRTALTKPTPEELAAAVITSQTPAAEYALLEIEDTGCGMPAETVEKIFEPFYTTKLTGRGLGLSAVLGIVKSHDGILSVTSQSGKGTLFKIWFKRVDAPPSPASISMETAEKWQGSGVILLVEDEPAIREMTSLMIKEIGFDVIVAENGVRGVEMFRENQQRIKLVIMDWNMPLMNGEEAFLIIREIAPDAKVLLASGYSEQEAFRRFQGRGLTGFLQKPYRFIDLVQKLQICMEK